jgi:hypothetical protein
MPGLAGIVPMAIAPAVKVHDRPPGGLSGLRTIPSLN